MQISKSYHELAEILISGYRERYQDFAPTSSNYDKDKIKEQLNLLKQQSSNKLIRKILDHQRKEQTKFKKKREKKQAEKKLT